MKKKRKWKVEYAPGFWKSFDRCFSNDLKYAVPRWFEDKKSEIKWAWQRVFRGFDDRVYWGLYNHLEWIIPKVVRWMKKNHHGCPSNLYDKTRKGNECWKWTEILEKIAKGFESAEKIDNKFLFKGKRFEKLNKQYKEGMKLFVRYFRNLWD